jgi:hypothetical protein
MQRPLNVSELWGWLRILLLIGAVGGAWAQLNYKLDAQTQAIDDSVKRGERIEHYLSSKDPNYWETVKRLE